MLMLQNEVENGNFPETSPRWKFRTNVIKQLASGLEYLHRNGLMHRDVKTDNVILKMGTALQRLSGVILVSQEN